MRRHVERDPEPGHVIDHAPRVVEGFFFPGEAFEDWVEGARGGGADVVPRQRIYHAKRLIRATELAEARDEGVEGAAARGTLV